MSYKHPVVVWGAIAIGIALMVLAALSAGAQQAAVHLYAAGSLRAA